MHCAYTHVRQKYINLSARQINYKNLHMTEGGFNKFYTSPENRYKNTVDSRYLEFQGTLWNTSRYPYFDISDLQN